MHTYAPHPTETHQRAPAFTAPPHPSLLPSAAVPDLNRALGNDAVQRMSQPGLPSAGESVTDIDAEMGAERPADFVGPLGKDDTRAVPNDFIGPPAPGVVRSAAFIPTMTVVSTGRGTNDCGGFTYGVRWGIPESEKDASGWIVQKVTQTFEATDCDGKPVVSSRPFDDPANYPYWEAWQFTPGGKVWVGAEADGGTHRADTFSSAASFNRTGTKGKKTMTGEVKAIVGFTLPSGMTPRNASPAWSLPYTRTEPALFASTLPGAAHTLTAEWDCCPNGTTTKATTVTTNP